ncbi:muramoyltetrapeptide carboxypeptidase LdcA involved in peptidoglycan recycling [Trichococcus patagoniensis]|uniref:Muramoyltetrapeptide carboxypeptidase LdcA involved in peptidoglycan recycling n=1 Tax=Trichococcus patagoniensis TaxID=382641 RepID=A0A2T5IL31_9LACT|nr:LD-carboxypeptidase [Trichococcus patagoniensis]PTQ84534.1 muramoyltetrapeptide carboxypeptidase LdcA involved in peptidoglycan recycling [Trichococcus patagoniensis]
MWHPGDAIGFISCSNGLTNNDRSLEMVSSLSRKLKDDFGLETVRSEVLFLNKETQQTEAPASRAGALLSLYSDASVKAIFDLSGGDLANEILPYLDFEIIKKNSKPYFGYSDNTVIVNAIQAKTGIQNVLYNPKVLVSREEAFQTQALRDFVSQIEADWTGTIEIGGKRASEQSAAVFTGGNLRCFLKLAGTPYWPKLENKVLVLESAGGRYEAMCSGLAQLEQLGAFAKINGMLIGQFTQIELDGKTAAFLAVCRNYASRYGFPLWETDFIGHDDRSKPVRIG